MCLVWNMEKSCCLNQCLQAVGLALNQSASRGTETRKKKKSHAGPSLSRYLKPGRQNGCGRCLMRRHTGSEEQELMVGQRCVGGGTLGLRNRVNLGDQIWKPAQEDCCWLRSAHQVLGEAFQRCNPGSSLYSALCENITPHTEISGKD